jgi:hypothetical protein
MAGRPRGPHFQPWLETLEARELLSARDLDLTFGTGGKVITERSSSAAGGLGRRHFANH